MSLPNLNDKETLNGSEYANPAWPVLYRASYCSSLRYRRPTALHNKGNNFVPPGPKTLSQRMGITFNDQTLSTVPKPLQCSE